RFGPYIGTRTVTLRGRSLPPPCTRTVTTQVRPSEEGWAESSCPPVSPTTRAAAPPQSAAARMKRFAPAAGSRAVKPARPATSIAGIDSRAIVTLIHLLGGSNRSGACDELFNQ